MPPPPSQKGKFKPRKRPPKKINAPRAPAPASDTASTTTVAFAPSTFVSRGDRGRDEKGRGKGRGRGRSPVPSGKVFFTGSDKKAAALSTKKKVVPVSVEETEESEVQEEIVGQLEMAIGSSKTKGVTVKRGILENIDYDDQDGQPQLDSVGGGNAIAIEGATYDSDSSQEEERIRRKPTQSSIKPMELPIPTETLPLGIGERERPISYESPQTKLDLAESDPSAKKTNKDMGSFASPFVDSQEKKNLLWEQDSWFLVQFPTRLPPLKQKSDASFEKAEEDVEAKAETVTSGDPIPVPSISEVVTQPVLANSFDNTLLTTAPGRIGKMVVYKSGKTVLVMEGPTGSRKVSWSRFTRIQ